MAFLAPLIKERVKERMSSEQTHETDVEPEIPDEVDGVPVEVVDGEEIHKCPREDCCFCYFSKAGVRAESGLMPSVDDVFSSADEPCDHFQALIDSPADNDELLTELSKTADDASRIFCVIDGDAGVGDAITIYIDRQANLFSY